MSTVTFTTITGPVVATVVAVEAEPWEGRDVTRYQVTVDGRLLGTVTKYRRSVSVLSGRVQVGTRTRWMWRYDVAGAIVRPANQADRTGRSLRLQGNYRSPSFTRTEAIASMMSAVVALDNLAKVEPARPDVAL